MYLNKIAFNFFPTFRIIEAQHLMYLNIKEYINSYWELKIEAQHLMYLNSCICKHLLKPSSIEAQHLMHLNSG